MDEKALLEWKETHADVYSKFKQDLEEQLLKPYHQTILDLGDGNAESLQSVIANLYAVSSKDGFDIEKLYTKAVESGDVSAYCLCCYLQFDNGADRLADALADKAEKPDAQEILDAVEDYKRFYEQNRKQEEPKITADELNILSLRRWHYDHPEEYKEFTATFQKAYDGDMTFIQTNFFFLMEMFSTKGVKGMMKIVASLLPGNMHYQQSLMGNDDNPLKGRLSEMLDSSLNNEAIRERLLHKNPYLFSLYYWIIFDNGFLHAADLISQTFLKPESPYWEKVIGKRCVETLIGASIDKAHYSKAQWKEVTQKLKKGETKQVIDAALLEVQGRRGRKSTYVILEEMLPSGEVPVLISEIQKVLSEWNNIRVVSCQQPDASYIVSKQDPIIGQVELDLGRLKPEDIGVEMLLATSDVKGNLHIQEIIQYKLVDYYDGVARYSVTVEPDRTGMYQVGIRMYANNPALPHRQDFPLVKWL